MQNFSPSVDWSKISWSNRMVDPFHLKILLAEDNITNQKLMLRQLQMLGYEADAVSNGAAAVKAVMESSYDLILMDCQMPVLDGFAATLAIRDWEQRSSVPSTIIVAMTASELQEDRDQAIAVGMNDYVLKPVRHEVLSALLKHWSEKRVSQVAVSSDVEECQTPQLDQVSSLAAGSSPGTLHLDLTYLHQLSDHCPEFEIELLQIFIDDSLVHLQGLKQAVVQQAFDQIEQYAHHIKGASANVGAKVMQTAAAQLEAQAIVGQAGQMHSLVDQIEASLQQIQHFHTGIVHSP